MQLGRALLLAGDDEAAQEQFEEATDLNPFFDMIRADVGDALQETGRLKGAAARHERPVELRKPAVQPQAWQGLLASS